MRYFITVTIAMTDLFKCDIWGSNFPCDVVAEYAVESICSVNAETPPDLRKSANTMTCLI